MLRPSAGPPAARLRSHLRACTSSRTDRSSALFLLHHLELSPLASASGWAVLWRPDGPPRRCGRRPRPRTYATPCALSSAWALRTLGQDLADSNQPSALRPWHARSFMDSALQRLSVALQRTIQRDQVLRSHLRRVQRGGVPADYYECGGDAGYRRSSSPSSSGSGSSSRTRGHRGVSSP